MRAMKGACNGNISLHSAENLILTTVNAPMRCVIVVALNLQFSKAFRNCKVNTTLVFFLFIRFACHDHLKILYKLKWATLGSVELDIRVQYSFLFNDFTEVMTNAMCCVRNSDKIRGARGRCTKKNVRQRHGVTNVSPLFTPIN